MQAMLMNRIGDWGLSIALFIILWLFGTSDYNIIFSICSQYNVEYITILTIFLFIAAIGKSAQLGLHTWLPSAMEGCFCSNYGFFLFV
jgi:NADH:ubiquinone oxidoreductase subunit 5 (subunit L)/multisubunit Na+/H+ antiporter MnhA subunit